MDNSQTPKSREMLNFKLLAKKGKTIRLKEKRLRFFVLIIFRNAYLFSSLAFCCLAGMQGYYG